MKKNQIRKKEYFVEKALKRSEKQYEKDYRTFIDFVGDIKKKEKKEEEILNKLNHLIVQYYLVNIIYLLNNLLTFLPTFPPPDPLFFLSFKISSAIFNSSCFSFIIDATVFV